MPAFIDAKLTVSDDHRAVINSYGFELKPAGGKNLIALIDPVISSDGKPIRAVGKNLEDLLREAIVRRETYNELMNTPAVDDDETEIASDAFVIASNNDDVSNATNDVDTVERTQDRTGTDVNDDDMEDLDDDLPDVVVDEEEFEPAGELSEEHESWLDNVEAALKKPLPVPAPAPVQSKSKKVSGKPNRYTRAARIIVKDPTITPEMLAKKAQMSRSTANHCLDAWHGILRVLDDNGWLAADKAATV